MNPGTHPPPLRLGWIEPSGEAALPWSPFRETGSLARLLFGCCALGERLSVAAGIAPSGALAAPPDARDLSLPLLLLDPRFVPDGPLPMARLLSALPPGGAPLPLAGSDGGDPFPVGWLGPPGWSGPEADALPGADVLASGKNQEPGPPLLRGTLLPSPWELMARNPERITRDLSGGLPTRGRPLTTPPPGVDVLGSWPVTMEAGVILDPQTLLDARNGPIHLGPGVQLRGHTRIEGPAWIGEGTHLLGGTLAALSVGPVCRIRGEVSESVIGGWCNKAHDGYLGHAVLGSWVNLGAFTTNSDLKNTYGSVRVPLGPDGTMDSGRMKVGVLLGDHVKTGIGTLLNTGTVVGAGSTLFAGGSLPPRWVPPFSWGQGASLVPARLDAFLEVATRAMLRRDRALSEGERARLEALWTETHGPEETPGPASPSPAPP